MFPMGSSLSRERESRLKDAFLHPINVAYLALLAIATLTEAHSVQDIVGPGLVAEVLYLTIATKIGWPRRRRRDAAQADVQAAEQVSAEDQLLAQIGGFERQRYLRLKHVRDGINQSLTPDRAKLAADELSKLDMLLHSFLQMLADVERYRRHADRLAEDDLAGKLERARRSLAAATDPELRSAHSKNLEILEKRLQEVGRFRRAIECMETQLEVIENAFSYISDKFVAMRPPQEIASDLDPLLANVESTARVAADLAPAVYRAEGMSR